MSDLDFSLEHDSEGNLCCPNEDCSRSFKNHLAIGDHYGLSHEDSIAAGIIGEEAWCEFLHTEHVEKGRPATAIANSLPDHIGDQTVLDELRRLDYYHTSPTGPINFGTQIISMPHIRTIEQAQEEAKRRREAQP